MAEPAVVSNPPQDNRRPIAAGMAINFYDRKGLGWTVKGFTDDEVVLTKAVGDTVSAPMVLSRDEFDAAYAMHTQRERKKPKVPPGTPPDLTDSLSTVRMIGDQQFDFVGFDGVQNKYLIKTKVGGQFVQKWVTADVAKQLKENPTAQLLEPLSGQMGVELVKKQGEESTKNQPSQQTQEEAEKAKKEEAIRTAGRVTFDAQGRSGVTKVPEKEEPKKRTEKKTEGAPGRVAFDENGRSYIVGEETEAETEGEGAKELQKTTEVTADVKAEVVEQKPQATKTFRQAHRSLQRNPDYQRIVQQTSWETLKKVAPASPAMAEAVAQFRGVSQQGFLIRLDGKETQERPSRFLTPQARAEVQKSSLRQYTVEYPTQSLELELRVEDFPSSSQGSAVDQASSIMISAGTAAFPVVAIQQAAGLVAPTSGSGGSSAQQTLRNALSNLRGDLQHLSGTLEQEGQELQRIQKALKDVGRDYSQGVSVGAPMETLDALTDKMSQLSTQEKRAQRNIQDTSARIGFENQQAERILALIDQTASGEPSPAQAKEIANIQAQFGALPRPRSTPPPIPQRARAGQKSTLAQSEQAALLKIMQAPALPNLEMRQTGMSAGNGAYNASLGRGAERLLSDARNEAIDAPPAGENWGTPALAAGVLGPTPQPAEEPFAPEGGAPQEEKSPRGRKKSFMEEQAEGLRMRDALIGSDAGDAAAEERETGQTGMAEGQGQFAREEEEMEEAEEEEEQLMGIEMDRDRSEEAIQALAIASATAAEQKKKQQAELEQADKIDQAIGNVAKGADVAEAPLDVGISAVYLLIKEDVALVISYLFGGDGGVNILKPRTILPKKYLMFEGGASFALHCCVGACGCLAFTIPVAILIVLSHIATGAFRFLIGL
ncbi:MAG: hypothetical protein WCV84_00915 [Patescibacteria group bacterium]